MRVLVYEYLTGGGLYSETGDQAAFTLLREEGRAMAEAVCVDLSLVAGVDVVRAVDSRLEASPGSCQRISISSSADEWAVLAKWSSQCDCTLLIAPESGGRLVDRCRLVEQSGGKLLSPDSDFVSLTADKCVTARLLDSREINTPRAVTLSPSTPLPHDFPYPAVYKPRDGAGSVDTHLIAAFDQPLPAADSAPARLEQWIDGIPASIAYLCGSRGTVALPPCRQLVSDDGCCRYLGGRTPLAPDLAGRVIRLGTAVMQALPPTTGYVGIDVILGADMDGKDDFVLDVNPRLTTSYVGLRQVARTNLAEAMLIIADGGEASLSFEQRALQFDSRGCAKR